MQIISVKYRPEKETKVVIRYELPNGDVVTSEHADEPRPEFIRAFRDLGPDLCKRLDIKDFEVRSITVIPDDLAALRFSMDRLYDSLHVMFSVGTVLDEAAAYLKGQRAQMMIPFIGSTEADQVEVGRVAQ